jgi:hypothetical protein
MLVGRNKRTLVANKDARVGSKAFLSTLMEGLSVLGRDSVFADCLSFDLPIATIECCAQQLVRKVWVEQTRPCPIGRMSRQNDGPRAVTDVII